MPAYSRHASSRPDTPPLPTPAPIPSLAASAIPTLRISTYNANSVSSYTNTARGDERHDRIAANLTSLALISDILLVQEAHLNHLDQHAFNAMLPGWAAYYSSKSNGFAGVVTLISPLLISQYSATVQPVDPSTQGHVLAVLLAPITGEGPSVLILNLYLATGKQHAARLTNQLTAAAAVPSSDYNFMGGDFNFVENGEDTTNSPHRLPEHSREAWANLLTHFRLVEAAQPVHSFFAISSTLDNSHSARLDRLYHSFSEADLSLYQPTAYIPPIPFSVLNAYRSVDIEELVDTRSREDEQLTAIRKEKSASDHLPVHMAWVSTQPDPAGFAKRPTIPPWTVREPEFERIFRAAWREQPEADPFREQARFNSGLFTASSAHNRRSSPSSRAPNRSHRLAAHAHRTPRQLQQTSHPHQHPPLPPRHILPRRAPARGRG